jgi:hypothetical protein
MTAFNLPLYLLFTLHARLRKAGAENGRRRERSSPNPERQQYSLCGESGSVRCERVRHSRNPDCAGASRLSHPYLPGGHFKFRTVKFVKKSMQFFCRPSPTFQWWVLQLLIDYICKDVPTKFVKKSMQFWCCPSPTFQVGVSTFYRLYLSRSSSNFFVAPALLSSCECFNF